MISQTNTENITSRIRSSFERQTMMSHLQATLGEITPGEVSIHLPFHAGIAQQHGFVHAGAIAAVTDSACGYAALSLMPEDAGVLSIEFKVNLLAPARGQRFEAVGKVLKPGRTILVCQGEFWAIDGDSRKLVSTLTATMMCVQGRGFSD